MARISTTTGTLLLLIALLIGCSKAKEDPTVIININDDLNILMWEELVGGERHFTFNVETVKDQNCMNYQLDYTLLNEEEENITLSIDQLIVPENCQPGNAPARLSVPIGSLESTAYGLELNLKDNEIINKGRLSVSQSQYHITMETDHGIILPESILYRVPNNTIWGYIGINDATQEFNVRNEFQALITDLVTTRSLTPGYYGHFRLADDDELTIDAGKEFPSQYNFLYQFEGDEQDLVTLLEDFRMQYSNLIEIKIFTANGSIL